MSPTRIARNVSTVAVASIAAWSSWSHMVHVALRFGERPEVAYVLPISVDGMLIVASTAMVEDKRAGQHVRWSARIAFLAGVGASVAANIAAAQPTLGARIVAAWPAVALLLVVESLSRARGTSPSEAAGSVGDVQNGAPVDPSKNTETAPDPAPAIERSRTMQTSDGPRQPRPPEHQRQRGGRTFEAAQRMRAEHPDASVTDIATHLRVSERHVRRLLASVRTEPR